MEEIFLSIAIPTFNRDVKLKNQLDSIDDCLSKSKYSKRIELLVSDNCSSDNTSQILSSFKEIKKTYKFTLNSNKQNLGGDKNIAISLQKASGRFVWVLCDDDIIEPFAIDYVFKELSVNKEVGFCFINYFIWDKQESNELQKNRTAIPQNENSKKTCSFEDFTNEAMFNYSMMSSCVFKKSLLTKRDFQEHMGESYFHLYWVAKILLSNPSLIIRKALFTFDHPGVVASREAVKNRESIDYDFYTRAHCNFLKFISYIKALKLPMKLRFKIYRLVVDENFSQIIHQKVTSEKTSFDSLKISLLTMIKTLFVSPSFWLIHLPLLVLPPVVAKKIEPLRWKYLIFRGYLVNCIRNNKTLQSFVSMKSG